MTKNVKTIIKNIKWLILEKKRYEKKYKAASENLYNRDGSACYYVIARPEKVGLFSYVETTFRYVAYALENGYIPVVQIVGNPNTYVEEERIKDQNMWELFFEQPYHVLTGKNIEICSDDKIIQCKEEDMSRIPYRSGVLKLKESSWFWSTIYKDFFGLNNQALEYCESEYKTLFMGNGNQVLGVLIRGTDIIKAKGHNIQPSVEMIIPCIKKYMRRGYYRKIYVASDEEKNVRRLEREFGTETVIVNKRVYYDSCDFSNGDTINDISFGRENEKYLKGLEYLSSVMLLSKCGGLIAGVCGGSIAAYYINGGEYKDVKFIDLGVN